MNNSINKIKIIIYLLFFILFLNLVKIIVIDKNFYTSKLKRLTEVYVYGESSPRGRIYDRNNNLLVDNNLITEIVYKSNKKSISEELNLIDKIIDHIDLDYSKISNRNLKEYYLVLYKEECSNKITEEEYIKYKKRILSLEDLNNLMISRITLDDLKIFNDLDKKRAYLFYLMNNGYSYQEKIIKRDISYQELAYFSENDIDGFSIKNSWERVYPYGDTFKSILGSIGNIPKEKKKEYLDKGYSLDDIVGLSNIEYQYEDILKGKKAVYKKIDNNNLVLISPEEMGNDIVLSIDINLVSDINDIIDKRLLKAKSEENTKYLNKSYVIIQDPNTGDILSINGRQILYEDNNYNFYDITPYALTDPMTPGSVVKGASMLVGFQSGVISLGEVMYDSCVKLYGIPKKCSSHEIGKMDDIRALAESSNVYQFHIAMRIAGIDYNYNTYGSAKEDNFTYYRNIFKEFGLGVKTEIDLPIESIGYSGNKYTIDLLLNYAIGQYDSYTPIQLSQYITTIANGKERLKPHLLKGEKIVLNNLDINKEYIDRVKEGFREVMVNGLGKKVMGNSPSPAGKTGTSETFLDQNKDGVIDTPTISQSFIGYAPSDNPIMTITVTSPDIGIINSKSNYLTYMNRLIVRDISNLFFSKYVN